MKYIPVLALVILTGCSTLIPVAPKFPEVPAELNTKCPDLQKTPETEKLSDVLNTVVDNYSQYHECQEYVMRWQEWYTKQKKIYEEVK